MNLKTPEEVKLCFSSLREKRALRSSNMCRCDLGSEGMSKNTKEKEIEIEKEEGRMERNKKERGKRVERKEGR